ncbi:hypothetical protein Tco_1309385, partial [Tanacetum coccineum]
LAGYYRRFIEGFLKIAKPMFKLTQKKERIKKTKVSKISQKPTRNGEDKKKSEDEKPNQSKAGSARCKKRKSMKLKMKVKGSIISSLQSLRDNLEVLSSKDQNCQKMKVVYKRKKENINYKGRRCHL